VGVGVGVGVGVRVGVGVGDGFLVGFVGCGVGVGVGVNVGSGTWSFLVALTFAGGGNCSTGAPSRDLRITSVQVLVGYSAPK
jgi:hypothetical protein